MQLDWIVQKCAAVSDWVVLELRSEKLMSMFVLCVYENQYRKNLQCLQKAVVHHLNASGSIILTSSTLSSRVTKFWWPALCLSKLTEMQSQSSLSRDMLEL